MGTFTLNGTNASSYITLNATEESPIRYRNISATTTGGLGFSGYSTTSDQILQVLPGTYDDIVVEGSRWRVRDIGCAPSLAEDNMLFALEFNVVDREGQLYVDSTTVKVEFTNLTYRSGSAVWQLDLATVTKYQFRFDYHLGSLDTVYKSEIIKGKQNYIH